MNFWNLQGGWRCGARVSCLGAFVSVCCGDVGLWVEAQFRNSGSGCVRHGGGVEAVRRADGVALALRSVSSLDVAVETVGEFCKRAGSGVDVGKTRCMLLGGLRDGCGGVGGVDITSDAVGCLGICIRHSGIGAVSWVGCTRFGVWRGFSSPGGKEGWLYLQGMHR